MKSLILLGSLFLSSLTFAQSTITSAESVKEIVQSADKLTNKASGAIGTTYDDAKSATTVVYNDGKSLVKQIYEDGKSLAPDIKEAFKALASGFNTTVDKLWNILVRQQYVWSIAYTIILLLTVYAWYKFSSSVKNTRTDLTDTKEIKPINVIYSVVLFVLAVYGTMHVGENIDRMLTGYINPEFGAVRTIVEFVKQ